MSENSQCTYKQVLVSSEAAMNSAVWHCNVCMLQVCRGSLALHNQTLHMVTQCLFSVFVDWTRVGWSKGVVLLLTYFCIVLQYFVMLLKEYFKGFKKHTTDGRTDRRTHARTEWYRHFLSCSSQLKIIYKYIQNSYKLKGKINHECQIYKQVLAS